MKRISEQFHNQAAEYLATPTTIRAWGEGLSWGGTEMKTYAVTIEARIIKTLVIEAGSQQEAVELAHQQFSVECEGDEYYVQETQDVEELR